MTTTKLPYIYIYYHDVNEIRPSLTSSDNFTIRRVVRQIQSIECPDPRQKAEQGVIQYNHVAIPVYRNITYPVYSVPCWTTNKEKALAGIKGTKL